MPKIKLIKRALLSELGDEFTVLTDAEVADSGINVGEDEVLIVEAPAPVQPTSQGGDASDEVAQLKARLHTVNQESAARRIELKQLREQVGALQADKKSLSESLSQKQTEAAQQQAKNLFSQYVTDKKLEFVSAEAGNDIQEMAFKELDWTKPVTAEMIEAAVKPILEKKQYVLKTVQLPPTDGGKQSSGGAEDVIMDDAQLAQIAQEFNLPGAFTKVQKE